MTNTYLDLLTKRAESKQRPLTRVPLCLDSSRYDRLREAREALHAAQKAAPRPDQQGRMPATKRGAADPMKAAEAAVKAAEDSVREASIMVVLEGRTADEITAGFVDTAKDASTREKQHRLILMALHHVEDLAGERIDEITREKLEGLLPVLTAGEITTLLMGITLASAAPDFPTSLRS